MFFKRKNKGFTVIEILAVIVILGILTAVAIPNVVRYITRSRKQAYETMEKSIYDGARNYVLDENKFLNKCDNGYSDIESGNKLLLKNYKYIDTLTDPTDNSKECEYKAYGCMESEQSMATLATYKYKIQIKCVDYEKCAVYRDDGSVSPCEDVIDDTEGPSCGEYTTSNNDSWSTGEFTEITINCVQSDNSGRCAQDSYTKVFTEESYTDTIEISDIFGNKTMCPVGVKLDRSAPSKPVINNPYEDSWTNKSYSIEIKSVDDVSGIAYFEYRYPDSSEETERNWTQWVNSSKKPGDDSIFTTTSFSKERSEYVEVRACDYAGNCSEISQSMIKIDKTAPTCSITLTGSGGDNALYTSVVSLNLNISDPEISSRSSLAGYGMANNETLTYNNVTTETQGATNGITWYGFVKDEAGNTNTCNTGNFKVFLEPPKVTFSLNGSTSTAVCTDALTGEEIDRWTLKVGNTTHTVTCTDQYGFSLTCSQVYKTTTKTDHNGYSCTCKCSNSDSYICCGNCKTTTTTVVSKSGSPSCTNNTN